jgi:hypothetical protein
VTPLGPFEDFKKEFDDLMARPDAARSTSPTAPEKFFETARKKIEAGDYGFAVDKPEKPNQAGRMRRLRARGSRDVSGIGGRGTVGDG